MLQSKASTSKARPHLRDSTIIIIIMALLATMGVGVFQQTNKISGTLDVAAYQNMENLMRTAASTVSATFASDEDYMQSLASTTTLADDMETWIETIDYDRSSIRDLYYGELDADTAYGKNGVTLNLSEHTFTEHKNGQVRSGAYMLDIGVYAYLLREPVQQDGKTVGYLYAEFLMTRFLTRLPQGVADNNNITLVEASTMTSVFMPSLLGSGAQINLHTLRYYLRDEELAAQINAEVEAAFRNSEYYMRILPLYRYDSGTSGTKNVVFYLWPVDDGEYYLSGVASLESLQSERNSVIRTITLMLGILMGISLFVVLLLTIVFVAKNRASRQRALTQQKHNEELDEALQIAKAANESKSNFLSNMSHDIRTPMNAIIGYTTLISKDADEPDKVREYVKKISGAGDYLLSLINDVLDMSKIESGKTTLNISQFSINKLANEVESIIYMQAEANQQTFTIRLENVEHDHVMGDEVRVRQIILNLLSNALKYTPNGGKINFTVQGVPQPKANHQKLRIIVQDNGYGMDAAYVKTIFDPFTRLNNSMTGKIQGTGLGLAITKSFVDLMGGTIDVVSVPNKGSTFTVELELLIAEDEPVAENKAAEESDAAFSLEGLHILAAEDNELNAEILSELLTMEGATCKICSDGVEIVQEFERTTPGTYDLLLMDVQMPNMNGYEATKAIRAGSHPEAKTIPIVAMTANAFAEDVMDALQAGMNAHIAKPVNMDVLKARLAQVLKNKKG